jgi:hypothetical protein
MTAVTPLERGARRRWPAAARSRGGSTLLRVRSRRPPRRIRVAGREIVRAGRRAGRVGGRGIVGFVTWAKRGATLTGIATVATVALAVATIVLAFVTREVAGQTRAAVRASVRPLLADVPPDAGGATIVYDHVDIPESFRLRDGAALDVRAWWDAYGYGVAGRSVAVRNIGNGPARVRYVRLFAPDPSPHHEPYEIRAWSVPSIIPAGGTARLMTVEVAPPMGGHEEFMAFSEAVSQWRSFTIKADYTDVSGKQEQTATIRVAPTHCHRGQCELAVEAFDVADA